MAIAIRDTCVAGATIDVSMKIPPQKINGKRSKKMNPTPNDVWEVNKRNAEKTLTRVINHNFTTYDWHNVLTYAGKEPSRSQAKKDREKFCRKLTEDGLKWIAVTEYKHERIHHHIIVQYMPFEYFTKLWTHGDVRPTPMKRKRNYKKLAVYLIKETSKTYRENGSMYKRRWSTSKNIEKPEVKREEIKVSDIYAEPKPLKGYYIDADTVRRFENPITGTPQIEYTMIALEEKPRLKKWYKGTVVLRNENYNKLLRSEKLQKQLTLEMPF